MNSASVGKYVNKTAPTGGSVKVSVIKPTLLVKVVGKSLGDTPIDISTAPTGNVYVVDTIVNDGETTRLCTQFAGCVHKLIAGDMGYKLICKGNSTGDAGCTAADNPCDGVVCDDGNPCNGTETCNAGSCESSGPVVCDDGNPCNGTETCNAGSCESSGPVVCDDLNPCTIELCNPATGCQTAGPVTCDDGNACTIDSCDPVAGCQAAPVVCNDGNACTTDFCDPGSGCGAIPIDPCP